MFDWVPGPFPSRGRRCKLGLPEREVVILLPPPPRRRGGGLISTLLRALLLFAP